MVTPWPAFSAIATIVISGFSAGAYALNQLWVLPVPGTSAEPVFPATFIFSNFATCPVPFSTQSSRPSLTTFNMFVLISYFSGAWFIFV